MSNQHKNYNSPEFQTFVKQIGEAESRQAEDLLILGEMRRLKQGISEKNPSFRVKRDNMIRLLYCEMLGFDCEFAYFKAIEYSADNNELIKKLGYMVAGICIPPDHGFRMMIVNQMCQDVQNDKNLLHAFTGLSAVRMLATQNFLQILMTPVVKLLVHKHLFLRKKAIMCLHRFYQIDPSCLDSHIPEIRRSIGDPDPSVMGTSLNLIYELCKKDPTPFKDMVNSLLTILTQIKDHKLPSDYDYHRIPAPWIQILLLKILGILGTADQSTSEKMYNELSDVLKRADVDSNIGYAICYECIRTICKIYPNDKLLTVSDGFINKFLTSINPNLIYLGIHLLIHMIKVNPKYTLKYQNIVMNCLDDVDITIKVRTLSLLYEMCNPSNVNVIINKMFYFIDNIVDEYVKKDIIYKISDLSEKYAPNPSWYIITMTKLFQLSGNLIELDLAQNIMNILIDGQGDDILDNKLRKDAVNSYLQLISITNLSTTIKKLSIWIIGEYGYLSDIGPEICINEILNVFNKEYDLYLKQYCLIAIFKLCVTLGSVPDNVLKLIGDTCLDSNVEIQLRSFLIQSLVDNASIYKDVLRPGSNEPLNIDENLKFCDSYVNDALAAGAKSYSKPQDYDFEDEGKNDSLNLEAYAKPVIDPSLLNRKVAVKEGTVTMKSIAENKRAKNVEKGLSEAKAIAEPPPPPKQRNAGFATTSSGPFGKSFGIKNLGGKQFNPPEAKPKLFEPEDSKDDDLYQVDDKSKNEANAIFSFDSSNSSTTTSHTSHSTIQTTTKTFFSTKETTTPSSTLPIDTQPVRSQPTNSVPISTPQPPPSIQEQPKPVVDDVPDLFAVKQPSTTDLLNGDFFSFNVTSSSSTVPSNSTFDPFANVNFSSPINTMNNTNTTNNNNKQTQPQKKDPFNFNFF